MSDAYADETQAAFLGKLARLTPDDAGMLMRHVGDQFYEVSARTFGVMARLTEGQMGGWTGRARNDYFLVALVAAIIGPPPRPRRGGAQKKKKAPPPVGNFGDSLRKLREKRGDGLDRQVELLLDADRDTLSHYLTMLAQDLVTERIRIDLATLLRDVLFWPSLPTRNRWATRYYSTLPIIAPTQEEVAS